MNSDTLARPVDQAPGLFVDELIDDEIAKNPARTATAIVAAVNRRLRRGGYRNIGVATVRARF